MSRSRRLRLRTMTVTRPPSHDPTAPRSDMPAKTPHCTCPSAAVARGLAAPVSAMFHDARQLSAGTQLDCDLCIIGAGAGGHTLARRFARGPLRVVLLESGGRANSAGPAELTGGEPAGWPYLPLAQTRQAGVGGTTGWWSGECRPLDADEDLGPRSWLHGAGWPVPATEIARYEAMAAAICGLGAQPFEPAADWLRAVGQTALPLDPRRFATKIFQYSSRLD